VDVLDDIQFYVMNCHHYADIPAQDERFASSWVDMPNSEFDPVRGHQMYQRYSRELKLIEELGYDAIGLNEHHNTPFSLMPAPSVRAGHVIASTERIKIMVAGVPLNLSTPNRVAEEYAMLDVMSGGRMEFGFPLGTGMEYWSNAAQMDPVTARARFREGLDVVLKAWTEPGPQRYEGEHFFYRYLNIWPRPYQQPRPKIYIMGGGSPETVDVAVEFDAGYSVVFTPIPVQLRAFADLREKCAARGRELAGEDIMLTVMAYVADTDAEAEREGQPYMERFFSWFHRVPPKYMTPPGYVTRANFERLASTRALAAAQESTWEDMRAIGRIAIGSPETVAETIAHWAREAGSSRIMLNMTHANMPEEMTVKNLTLFANEVIPRIRTRTAVAR
jgi:alkanesulfonate monooxygenase SsuD/methylene tetrahydromethanopterin reductase-like flavin-dependent oxidoreductase (luciferase family)